MKKHFANLLNLRLIALSCTEQKCLRLSTCVREKSCMWAVSFSDDFLLRNCLNHPEKSDLCL